MAKKKSLNKNRTKEWLPFFKKLLSESMNPSGEEDKDILRDGDRVKINVDQITVRPEWSGLNQAYCEFVLSNRDTVFTAKIRSATTGGYPVIVDLEEDRTWSFWSGDLIRLETENTGG